MAPTLDLSKHARAFLNFCQLEKGLSAATIQAYSDDLKRFTEFSQASEASHREILERYLDQLRKSGLSDRSLARHLTTIRGLFGYLLREGVIEQDPADHLRAPKQWQTIPKFLNLEQIERLIRVPDRTRPTGQRDWAMLELLYATGLRVSELCRLGVSDLNLELGVLRTTGKGNKQRLVPAGKEAVQAVGEYVQDSRPALLRGRPSRYLFVTARGGCLTRFSSLKRGMP